MTESLAWLQIAAHLITFGAVAFWYCDKSASFRPLVSLLATAIAGLSLSNAIWVMVTGDTDGALAISLFVTFCGLVLRAGGNVALLLPPRVMR